MLTCRRIVTVHEGELSYTPKTPRYELVSVENDVALVRDAYGLSQSIRLKDTVECIVSSDDWRGCTEDKYALADIVLPDWLSTTEWIRDQVAWKWTWGMGADSEWPETWQRGIKDIKDAQCRRAAIKLLAVKKFRSAFRQELRQKLEAWLTTPVENRAYTSPFSYRQWNCLIDAHTAREAEQYDVGLYRNKGWRDARKAA